MADTVPALNPTQMYDEIASDYDIIWNLPAMQVLWTTLDKTLGSLPNLKSARVLDLACGTGIGLREARKFGAVHLVGVDISPEMIEVCRATKGSEEFQLHVADCSAPLDHLSPKLEAGGFDLVIGMWLLNYAESSEMLGRMWGNIATYLKPNGVFFGIIQNQDTPHPSSMHHLKYGAMETEVKKLESGDGVKMHVQFDTSPKVEIDTWVLTKEIFEAEAKKAGMRIDRYVRSTEGDLTDTQRKGGPDGKGGVEWWRELLDEYPNQIVIATKI